VVDSVAFIYVRRLQSHFSAEAERIGLRRNIFGGYIRKRDTLIGRRRRMSALGCFDFPYNFRYLNLSPMSNFSSKPGEIWVVGSLISRGVSQDGS
jgi:hypothetical protein